MEKPKTSKSEPENGTEKKSEAENFLVVGIGASAGGVQALKEFFENVPAESGAAYVVILHLSPDHESKLAEILQTTARIPVTRVTEQVHVEPNHVYVVSPNQSFGMVDGSILVSPVHTIEERRAPIDIFFRTLAEARQSRAIAVVLSGTGADGSMGLKRVKERGGAALVQNPREAEFSEMPRNSIATDLVDAVLNAGEIPAKIVAYRANLGAVKIQESPEFRPEDDQAALREIFNILRVRTGHDFSDYKRATLLRRIERRINVVGFENLPDYAARLRENPNEGQALLKDLLISVTNFFRDKESFAALEREILPRIARDKRAGDQIRVWVSGCATGEEAYSIAMLLAEQTEGKHAAPTIQVFATDIDEAALAVAREGFYTINDAADVSPERLRRFFTAEADGFRIRRELRETVLFATHNLLKDPPFSRLDLATCRNLLIYFNREAQERAMETFHFALNPGGFLFLGTSESIDGSADLYAAVSKEHNIFQSRQTSGRFAYPVPEAPTFLRFTESRTRSADSSGDGAATIEQEKNRQLERISFGDLHRRLLEQYAPPSIVVNENYDIVHLSETAGRFLRVAGGEPSKNLLRLIRPELRLELRAALYQAVQHRTNVEAASLKVRRNGNAELINLSVRPVLHEDDTARGFLLVLFEPSRGKTAETAETAETVLTSHEPISRQLEAELERAKGQLRSSIERYEVQTEELRASNEELQAMNEELRSSAEELETSREELQSVNEELVTVNQELKIKVEELSHSNSDFQNLMNSTDIGTIFLDRSLRVRMFTPSVREVFNLIEADLNRPLADITTKLDFDDLLAAAEGVLDTLQTAEREVETRKGKWYLMRIFPYRTAEDRISGVVVMFVDITQRKQSEEQLSATARRLENQSRIFDTTLSAITDFAYIFDRDGRFVYANQPMLDLLGVTIEEITGKSFSELPYPKDLADRLERQIRQVFETKKVVVDETLFTSPAGVSGFYEYIFTPVFAADGSVEVVAGSTRNTTERRQAEEALRESETRFRATFEQANVGIVQLGFDGRLLLVNPGFSKIVGYTEAECQNLNCRDISQPDDFRLEQAENERLLTGEISGYTLTKRYIHKNGSIVWGNMTAALVLKDAGEPYYILAIIEDITTRKQAEEALRESRERLQLLVESVTDYAILTVDENNLINSWNVGSEKVFGYQEHEIIGAGGEILFTHEDRERGVPAKEMRVAAESGRAEDERWHVRKDGSRFYASGVMMTLKNGKGFVKVARDMTDKIKIGQALHDKEMLQKLVGAQEDERKRIARDLHDQLGQQLTALRLKLEAARKLCGKEEITGKIDEIQLIAKHIDADVDFLAWELRPAALDDLGLVAALGNYVAEWSKHSGVTAEFHVSGLKKTRLASEVETNLYRIGQEALNNVYKHARATQVSVLLERHKDKIVLIVEDNGVGFNPADKKTKSKGIGLIGMSERAAILGGALEIESSPKKGTTVFARISANQKPVESRAKAGTPNENTKAANRRSKSKT